jgi:hypothetical protein
MNNARIRAIAVRKRGCGRVQIAMQASWTRQARNFDTLTAIRRASSFVSPKIVRYKR